MYFFCGTQHFFSNYIIVFSKIICYFVRHKPFLILKNMFKNIINNKIQYYGKNIKWFSVKLDSNNYYNIYIHMHTYMWFMYSGLNHKLVSMGQKISKKKTYLAG